MRAMVALAHDGHRGRSRLCRSLDIRCRGLHLLADGGLIAASRWARAGCRWRCPAKSRLLVSRPHRLLLAVRAGRGQELVGSGPLADGRALAALHGGNRSPRLLAVGSATRNQDRRLSIEQRSSSARRRHQHRIDASTGVLRWPIFTAQAVFILSPIACRPSTMFFLMRDWRKSRYSAWPGWPARLAGHADGRSFTPAYCSCAHWRKETGRRADMNIAGPGRAGKNPPARRWPPGFLRNAPGRRIVRKDVDRAVQFVDEIDEPLIGRKNQMTRSAFRLDGDRCRIVWRQDTGAGVEFMLMNNVAAKTGVEHEPVARIDNHAMRVRLSFNNLLRVTDHTIGLERTEGDLIAAIRCGENETTAAIGCDVAHRIGQRTAADQRELSALGINSEGNRAKTDCCGRRQTAISCPD